MKILTIAPESLVGSRFVEMASAWAEVTGAGLSEKPIIDQKIAHYYQVDITSQKSVNKLISQSQAEYVVNFAGFTDVAKAEELKPTDYDESKLAENLVYKLNVVGIKNLATACHKYGKVPIFISTDFVFDGTGGPYRENDQMAQNRADISWYGWTKKLADEYILGNYADALIVRISYPYRKEFGLKGDVARNFLKMYDRFAAKEIDSLYPVFTDQFFTPTFIDDLSPALKLLIEKKQSGVFHVASPEIASFYDFVCYLLKNARGITEPENIVQRGSIVEYLQENPQKAKWPIQGGLKVDKISMLGFSPTSWREGLKDLYT